MGNESPIGVGLIGCGTVGCGVVRLLSQQGALYAGRLGRRLELRRVLVRDPHKPGRAETVDPELLTDDLTAFLATPNMAIVVEVAGGCDPIGRYVRQALAAGKHLVTANKSLLATDGRELFALARQHNVCIAFEGSCGGGIPIVAALQFGLAANRLSALYGILNGTSNYILTEMTQRNKTYADALREAQQEGFAEVDPRLDVSGRDAVEKLTILASLAFGVQIEPAMVCCAGIDQLDCDDIRFGAELGYEIKLLAIAERIDFEDSGQPTADADWPIALRVQPCFLHKDLPLAQVHGSFNALTVYGHAVGQTMFLGRGAGQMPTASAVVADLLNVASGWYPSAFARVKLWPDSHRPVSLIDSKDLKSRFYLRINARDTPSVVAKVGKILGDAQISLGALLQHEVATRQFVPVVIITHEARQGSVQHALEQIEQLDVIEGRPVCIQIVDMPNG